MTTSVGFAIALPTTPAIEPAATLIHSGLCAGSSPPHACSHTEGHVVSSQQA